MIEKLSLGGGIIFVDGIDFGFCTLFDVSVSGEEIAEDRYYTDENGSIFRASFNELHTTRVDMEGLFVCESLDRNLMQSIWFRGDNNINGTELFGNNNVIPMISSIKFISSPATGPRYCIKIPIAKIVYPSNINFIIQEWKNIEFNFSVMFGNGNNPIIQVEEEGELIPNFCS